MVRLEYAVLMPWRKTTHMVIDPGGVCHEAVWLIGVAYVVRCTRELPSNWETRSIRNNPTTCLLCLGART